MPKGDGSGDAEDYFLAGRSLGPAVFLLSLFGTNMTAFSILGASGHAFANGIVTYGLMASSSALVIPLGLFVIGTRLWALGKRYGFMTPVQMFRDRWECGHIGTVIFAVQAVLLVPYIVIAVMGGGTTLRAVSGGLVPYWLGGAIVSLVVMGYVFFGGMRGTAWVNTFQTVLFLSFGAIAVVVIGARHGRILERHGIAARIAGHGAAPHARTGVAAVLSQLHLHPALVDRLSAHRHLLPDGEAPLALPQDRHPLSALHAGDLAAVGLPRRRGQQGDRHPGDPREARGARDARHAGAGPDAGTARRAPGRVERRRRDPASSSTAMRRSGWRRCWARR